MQESTPLSDAAFEHQFAIGQLPPALFNHEAHLRLAWIHIHQYGLDTALINIETQLKNYVVQLGATDKYHHTLTIAAVKAVAHFMQHSSATTFPAFIATFPELKNNFKALINSHYSFDIFTSNQARQTFIEPDLHPF